MNKILYISFTLFALISCNTKHTGYKSQVDTVLSKKYNVDSTSINRIDTTIYNQIQPYKDSLQTVMNNIVAVSDTAMIKGRPESLLSNWVADVFLSYARKIYNDTIHACVYNMGGIRAILPKGNITLRNIYQLMPFENELVVLQLKGTVIYEMVNHIALQGGDAVSGLTLKIKNNKAQDILIQGFEIDTAMIYTILTNDFIADGGDKYYCFKKNIMRQSLDITVRNALLNYLNTAQRTNVIQTSKLDGRIEILQ